MSHFAGRSGTARRLLILLFILPVTPCAAGELLASRVEHRGDHFLLHLDMRIHARAADVYAVLVDFPHLPKVNDAIQSAEELQHKGRMHRVRMVIEGCVWIFCRRVKEIDTVTESGDGYIVSVTDAEHSDFHYGRALWQVIDEGKTTRVKYNADYVPAFWVPPLIGPAIFKHRMLKEGKKTINGIERLAQPKSE